MDPVTPKFPPGTPEYAVYSERLSIELEKYAAGEYPYGSPTVGRLYQVTTADDRRIRAFFRPIDGIRANHPWLGEDEARHRFDSVRDVQPLAVVGPPDNVDELIETVTQAIKGTGGTVAAIVRATLATLDIERKS